ncbi:ATP-binding cassette domain-containing protein [Streptomyces halstedii]|uniref:ATP-binding cassette domain-containing protein n=1 Tax=Streptomyces halstedii TaxID=1944 RepID=UPI003867274D
MAGTPRLLVLDEPTSGLDTVLAAGMRRLLAEVLADGGRSALLVSHDPVWIASVADDVIRLEGGRIAPAGVPKAPKPVPPPGGGAGSGRGTPWNVTPVVTGELSARGLDAAHGRVPVLHDISLTAPAGGCTAVVGPSGSGKSTLARCLAGLHRPTRGSVEWREDDAGRGGGAPVQLVAQDARGALNPRESVRTALLRPLTGVGRLPAREAEPEAVRLLGLVGLEPGVLARRPGELSGGQRQRVAHPRRPGHGGRHVRLVLGAPGTGPRPAAGGGPVVTRHPDPAAYRAHRTRLKREGTTR